jgi:hypothetical protein
VVEAFLRSAQAATTTLVAATASFVGLARAEPEKPSHPILLTPNINHNQIEHASNSAARGLNELPEVAAAGAGESDVRASSSPAAGGRGRVHGGQGRSSTSAPALSLGQR